MRRFEFSDGKSDKFWQVAVQGADVTTSWGRIGTNGQTKTKTFTDADTASRESEKQIRSKVKKGYAEVDAAPVEEPTVGPPEAVEESVASVPPAAVHEEIESPEALEEAPLEPLPPFESFVDLKGLRRWAIRGQVRFRPPSDVGAPWADPRFGALQPVRLKELAAALATGEVLSWDLAELGLLLKRSQGRRHWEGTPGNLIDPFAAADLAGAFDLCVTAAPRLRPDSTVALFGRLGEWISVADQKSFDELSARADALFVGATQGIRAGLTVCFRRSRYADALLAVPPTVKMSIVAVLASDPADAGRQFEMQAPTWSELADVFTLLMQVHGASADKALVPGLTRWRDHYEYDRYLKFAARCVTPDMARFFGGYEGTRAERKVAQKFLDTHPELCLRIWGQEVPKKSSVAEACFVSAVVRQPELARRAALGGREAAVEALLGSVAEAAPAGSWPKVLQDPPWRRSPVPTGTVDDVVEGLSLPHVEESIVWPPGRLEEVLATLKTRERPLSPTGPLSLHNVAFAPSQSAALAGWNSDRVDVGHAYGPIMDYLLAKLGVAGVDRMIEWAPNHFSAVLGGLLRLRSARVAPILATRFDRKSLRPMLLEWFLEHVDVAVPGLIPTAFGKAKKPRALAQEVLRAIADEAPDAFAASVAAAPAQAKPALARLLAFDPMDVIPRKRKKVAPWIAAPLLPPLVLRTGGALPPEAVDLVVEMLAFSSLDKPYPGIAELRDAVTSASAGAFSMALFRLWLGRGAEGAHDYCLLALGHLGGDDAVHVLTPLVRKWPGEAAHARAVKGLDVLRAIGSDVALMQLYGISQKLKFRGLKQKAGEKVQEIAEERGLTSAELADRLVPDLGLDADGSRVLDFGPRTFTVGFDESLKPWVADAAGKRRKQLPKPGVKDDPELANEATLVWKTLKRDARATASAQLSRLERSMVDQRRWKASDWRRFFVRHPLIIHLVRRLVWGVYVEGTLLQTFRVAEDGSFADVEDEPFVLPDLATIGIPHRLELEDADGWGDVLGDYEILQPFDQLARPVFLREPGERDVVKLRRVEGQVVHWGKVRGLDKRGWHHGHPQDGGCIWEYHKTLPDGRDLTLQLSPGLYAGAAELNEDQTLGVLTVREKGRWNDADAQPWRTISDVVFSELALDLSLMTQE